MKWITRKVFVVNVVVINPNGSSGLPLLVKTIFLYGPVTEWLGSGLQNRVRQFNSALDLKNHH